MRSFLVLGDGSRLSLDAIAKLSFEGIDLVTLSACQTALGGAVGDDGREIEGSGVDSARASQQSQLELRALSVAGWRPYEQPFFWAGFVTCER